MRLPPEARVGFSLLAAGVLLVSLAAGIGLGFAPFLLVAGAGCALGAVTWAIYLYNA